MSSPQPPAPPQQPQPQPQLTYWEKYEVVRTKIKNEYEQLKYFKDEEYNLVVEATKTVSVYYPERSVTVEHIKMVTNMPWFLQKLDVDVNFNVTDHTKRWEIKENLRMRDRDSCDASCWYEGNYPCDHDGSETRYTGVKMRVVPKGSEGPVSNKDYYYTYKFHADY